MSRVFDTNAANRLAATGVLAVSAPSATFGCYIKDDKTGGFDRAFFGSDSTVWTKIAFYFQMNSEPGVDDGIFRQWLNDVQIRNETNRVWNGTNVENINPGWNAVSIGGNQNFYPFPDADQYEDWYAIDNLMVSSIIPEGLL
jgi:hypothetical protein